MKRISALFLVLCMVLCAVAPMTAFATANAEDIGEIAADSGETATPSQLESDGGEAAPDQEALTETEPGQPPLDSEPPEQTPSESVSDSETTPEPALGESGPGCDTQGIAPLSGWEDGGSEFYTKIRLTVTDRNGNPTPGVVYGLYRASDNGLVEYLTTDRYGVAVSGDVPVDTDYYLLEYSIPAGYLPNPEPKHINLTEICAPSRVDENVVYDLITGNIRVIKTDEDGNALSGVGFYVYRSDTWELVDTIYTNTSGEATTTTLPYGWYELYEFDVPQGMAGGGYYSQMIEYDGQTHDLHITNYRAYGSAYVYKSGNDGRKIQGAVFSIYRVTPNGDEWIEDITTSGSGYAYSSPLLLGDYFIVEKSVPAPYALDATRRDFSLYYNGQSVSFNLTNNREGENGTIKAIKTDDSGNPLSGVVFGVYRSWDGAKITELTTGVDGTAEYSLIPDDYYLVELSGKAGYEMATGQIPFTIDGTGATVEQTVINPKIRIFGKVTAIKKDEAGNPIPGVRLGVYCQRGNLLEELTTGPDGTATSGVLNEGTGYYLMELEGAPGHLTDYETQYPFDITQNNVIVPVNITNPRITGGVKVIKDDGEGYPLWGVVFGIYKNGVKLMELTTSSDGTATSGTLYYGDDYELRELSTVEGYELIDTPIPFSILEQDVIIEIPVSNPLILGSVTVIKVDAEDIQPISLSNESGEDETEQPQSNPLSGAVFGIYNERGQKIAELTVDETGRATYSGLPKSGYFLKELVAPEGFVPLDELIPFAINEQGDNVEITVPNSKGYGTVKIIKHGENETLPGVVFEVYRAANDEKIAELTTGEDGTALQELPLGRYYLLEKSTVSGYLPLNGSVSFVLTDAGVTVELAIENQREPAPEGGRIKLIKTDATDDTKLLPGAVFGIYRADNDEKIAELVTGSDGTATGPALPELENGYYLLELTAPASYKAITDKIPVTAKNGETTEITVKNEPLDPAPENGTLEIIKKSDSGVRLQGAVFGVYRAPDDTKITELTTDNDGRAVYDLPEGDFYLKELKCDGYKLITEKIPFRVTAGDTKTVNVTNTPKDTGGGSTGDPDGRLKIIKKSEDGERLQGAVFGVYRASNDRKIAELTTNKNGEATYDLPEGDFYLKELTAPTGFKLDSSKTNFRITSGRTKEITVINQPLSDEDTGRVLLIKKAEGTGRLLPDAVFGVYRASNNEKVAELTTDSSGEAYCDLPLSDYYMKELKAPSGGYILETAKIPFSIKKSGVTVTVEVTNMQGRGSVKLIKTGADGEAVSGAVFTLYRQDGTQIAELVSGKDGTVTYDLPIGGFYLVEKSAAVGYRLDTRRYSFDIQNGRVTEVKVVNQRIQGTVEVYFKHVQDGRELAAMKSYTDNIGADYVKWMRNNGYENMQINGYRLIRTDYPSSFVLIDGKLVVTLWYDNTETTSGGITIPKTGEAPPYGNYILSALCMSLAGICGVMLYRGRSKRRQTT